MLNLTACRQAQIIYSRHRPPFIIRITSSFHTTYIFYYVFTNKICIITQTIWSVFDCIFIANSWSFCVFPYPEIISPVRFFLLLFRAVDVCANQTTVSEGNVVVRGVVSGAVYIWLLLSLGYLELNLLPSNHVLQEDFHIVHTCNSRCVRLPLHKKMACLQPNDC